MMLSCERRRNDRLQASSFQLPAARSTQQLLKIIHDVANLHLLLQTRNVQYGVNM